MDIKNDLKELIEQNWSYEKIGQYFNCSREKIRRIAIKLNVNRQHIYAHPNLIIDYFEQINSNEKAYWLGFLYADGYVHKNNCTLVIDLSTKDINQIERFCNCVGANFDKVKIRNHDNFKNQITSVSIRISNKMFVNNIVKWGCVNNKSKIITWPQECLKSKELQLSFLAGYYDGDGIAGTSIICSGAKQFLCDIKKIFDVKNDIILRNTVYTLKLGAKLKIDMVKTYPFGIKRKQGKYHAEYVKPLRIEKRKFNPSKEELENLIIGQKMPYSKIGKLYNISDNAVKKRAILLGIILPIRNAKNKIRKSDRAAMCLLGKQRPG